MGDYKYKNYEELFAAFESGELDKDKFMFIVDNDVVFLHYMGDDMGEDEAYEYTRGLFRGDSGYSAVIEILCAMGFDASGA